MPPFFSLAALRLRPFPPASAVLRRARAPFHAGSFATLSSRENPRRPAPDKNLLKARDIVKDLPSATSPLDSDDDRRRHLHPSQAVGLVAAAQANFMRVIVVSAGGEPENPGFFGDDPRVGRELLCVVRALLKKIKRRVLVGDRVLVGSVDWVDRRGMIEDVFKRSSEILDPPVANVNNLLVLFSMDQPKPEPFTLTRFLVEAESTGLPLTLAMNKSELVGDETLSVWKERLHGWGYKPLFCSVDQKSGLAAVEDILKRKTTVVVGPSGVGKSSLINSLRLTLNISDEEKINKLLEHYEKSYLADTPGFNQPSLMKVTKKSLAETFPEIRQMLSASEPLKCAFNDCLHLGEPGCIVKADWERYPYYLQLLDEIRIRGEFQLRTIGTKRESDVRYKVRNMGVKQAEPRLELKRHRRISRTLLKQSILDDLNDLDELEDYWKAIATGGIRSNSYEETSFTVL
ncbi:hypothetical protein OPV22_019538 [Ensete ventricosum]|uniref:EngC GTPase domain-containing protein n=1 Tax=Ensete ventricosum TaxID=4639 RepID=A0AAV8QBQ1_ENSVE|nr:hypothetical protein OPV22_019538 [Ensete ventricosum]